MNLLRFLKSKKGAIKTGPALCLSGTVALGFYFIANTAAHHQAARQLRAVSSIEQSSALNGMQRQNGMLTSIQVRDGRNQVATAEERAAMGGNSALERYNANQRALGNMEASFGRAAEFSDADGGLNTGNRDYEEGNTRFSVGNPNVRPTVGNRSGSDGGAEDYNDAYRSGAAGSSPATLAHASMARASGNSFGGTSGPIASAGSGAGSGNTSGATGEGARLSGAMPGGSNIVSKLGLEGANAGAGTSSFGRDRDARGSGSRRNGSGKGELNDILKKSAEAAANKNASANEGGRAFLAGGRSSGGLSVDGSGTVGYGTSSDLSSNTAKKLKAIGNRLSAEEAYQKEREAAHKHVQNIFWGMLAASVASIVAISLLHKATTANGVMKLWAKIVMWGLVAAVVVMQEEVIRHVIKFTHKYPDGGNAFTKLMVILAPVLVGAAVYSAIVPDAWGKIWTTIKTKFMQMFSLAGIVGTVTGAVSGSVKSAVGEAVGKKGK